MTTTLQVNIGNVSSSVMGTVAATLLMYYTSGIDEFSAFGGCFGPYSSVLQPSISESSSEE
jgi:hypothetical protein